LGGNIWGNFEFQEFDTPRPLTDLQVKNAKPGKRPPARRKGDPSKGAKEAQKQNRQKSTGVRPLLTLLQRRKSRLGLTNSLLDSFEVDLMLLDLRMPKTSGIDLLQTLKDRPSCEYR